MSDEDIFLTHAQKMDAFYYSPLAKPKADRWFSNFPIVHNTLQGIIKRLCRNTGIEGKRTNHSLGATSATRQYRANVVSNLLASRQAIEAKLCALIWTSEDQKLLVSDIIYGGGKQKKSVTATRPSPDDATAPPSVATAIPSSAAPHPAVSSEIVSDHDLREKTKDASRNICITFNFS